MIQTSVSAFPILREARFEDQTVFVSAVKVSTFTRSDGDSDEWTQFLCEKKEAYAPAFWAPLEKVLFR